jgi:hypothetical protein
MPFWSGGYLYIPATIFTGTVWKSLGVVYNYNASSQVVILYSSGGNRRSLIFYLNQNYAQDRDGNVSYPGGLLRGGVPYVPAALVADFFELQYSVTKVSRGYLVWLREPGFGLSDKDFAGAASRAMEERYNEYLKAKEAASSSSSASASSSSSSSASTPAAATPAEPAQTEEAPSAEIQGKRIYLCLQAGSDTASLLDVLDRYQVQAAFFCTQSFLEEQGDLLRRMTAAGQTVGLLVDADDSDRTVVEQLEAGNRALEQATCGKTRLAMILHGGDADKQAALEAGYRALSPDLDRSGYDLQGTANAASLLQRVSARKGDVTVWLADRADAAGLRAFLAAAESGDGECLAWNETA